MIETYDGVAIHKTATIGHNVTIKAPAIIGPGCFVGSNSCLRYGIFMARGAKVCISCEIKTTIMLENSAVAHFNFVGDSIIGMMNIEALPYSWTLSTIVRPHAAYFATRQTKPVYHPNDSSFPPMEKLLIFD